MGNAQSVKDLVQGKTHHVLGNDGEEIVVFGLTSSIMFLSQTTLIQGDGTFTCVVLPFTQLYMFHALLKNGVSYPLLYCLVRGKTEAIYKRLLALVEKIARERGTTILHRSVRLMVDFELSFINAARQYEAGRGVSCSFFHYVSNIKKKARPVIDALKKDGENTPEVKLAQKTKRAVMMLPLLPMDLITVEVVDMIFWRWSASFPDHAADFAKLYRHVVKNYVGPNARFPVQLWCVSGRSTRTNNAAESSHAVLNASVKVSGAVSLNMFLFAIERQMRHTSSEIAAGCPSHTKTIYARRNELLATELSDLFNGKQGPLAFLDHCGDVLKVKNKKDIQTLKGPQNGQLQPIDESGWIRDNHGLILRAAMNLYATLFPQEPKRAGEILATVHQWAYQQESSDVDVGIVGEDSTLSLAGPSVVASFLEIQNRFGGRSEEAESRRTVIPAANQTRNQAPVVHQGASYRLEIRQVK